MKGELRLGRGIAYALNFTLKDNGNKISFNFYCPNWKIMKK